MWMVITVLQEKMVEEDLEHQQEKKKNLDLVERVGEKKMLVLWKLKENWWEKKWLCCQDLEMLASWEKMEDVR